MSLKIAFLASGRGSNVQAILNEIETGALKADVQCLISNIPEAPVLQLSQSAGIKTFCIPHRNLTREHHEAQVLEALNAFDIDYLVLAGYMRLITPEFLEHFQGEHHYRVINIHPSLLPAFPGTHAYEDAYHYGVKYAGVTVHFVDEAMDNGPILLQETFPRYDEDTLEAFKARGLALEHCLYPKALKLLSENAVQFRYNPISKRYYPEVIHHVPC